MKIDKAKEILNLQKQQVNKTDKILFRLSPIEKNQLITYCNATNQCISTVIRMAIDKLINNK